MEPWELEDWEFDDLFEWEAFELHQDFLNEVTFLLADRFFLSDNDYFPNAEEDYNLGHLRPEAWWSLVNQLDEMMDLEILVDIVDELDDLVNLPGLPTELLEAPLNFLLSVLNGHLPKQPSGRRVGSPKLVKIGRATVNLLKVFKEPAQAATRAWADVHRGLNIPFDEEDFDFEDWDEEDLADLLFSPDLPPAMTGFSMMIALTLMHWPERAEGLPLPPGFAEPELYDDVLAEWETLPDSPNVTEEGTGEAEALFAQAQLAHMLAQTDSIEVMAPGEIQDEDKALAYSRLSRAILWVHNQCRHCPERDGIACKAADNWPDRPVPLLDVAGEIANTSRIGGCIRM
jgi:hypothetical protein